MVRSYDTAGAATTDAYDFKGNALRTGRAVARRRRTTPSTGPALEGLDTLAAIDAAAAPLLEVDSYIASAATTRSTGSRGRSRPTAARRRSASTRAARCAGRAWTACAHVTGLTYNARGQREQITYGNGVATTYQLRARDVPAGATDDHPRQRCGALQDLPYTYDPVGNIVADRRRRPADTLFFDNARSNRRRDYAYDAIYQLIAATGREHCERWPADRRVETPFGSAAPPQRRRRRARLHRDVRLRRGRQLLSMTHSVHGGVGGDGVPIAGATLWTRRYQVAPTAIG